MAEDSYDCITSAIKYFVGNSNHVCRLCLSIIHSESEEVSLDDTVALTRSFYAGSLTFRELFQELSITMDDICLPKTLCMNCSKNAINSYLFKMFCNYSLFEWDLAIDKLSSSMPTKFSPGLKKSMVLLPNANTHLTSVKVISKVEPLKDIKTIILRKNCIKRYRIKKLQKTKATNCDQCPDEFPNTIELKKHRALQHAAFSCSECQKHFVSNHLLVNHNEKNHLPKTIKCQKCKIKFSTERLLNIHIKRKHVAVDCKICNITLPSKHELKRHSELHRHGYDCPKCSKHFTRASTLAKHRAACGVPSRPHYICDICQKAYVSKQGLIGHMTVDHGFGTAVCCPWCDKKFDQKSKLNSHAVKHTRERKFSCEVCGGAFVTQAALTYHIRLHTGEKPYECDYCGEKFLSASRRMEHKRRKHLGPDKLCRYCGQRFVTSHELKKHTKRHLNPQSKLYQSTFESKIV